MSARTPAAADATPTEPRVEHTPKKEEQQQERPPQQEELLCTICHMPSCWR
jgi:hypothetical protein